MKELILKVPFKNYEEGSDFESRVLDSIPFKDPIYTSVNTATFKDDGYCFCARCELTGTPVENREIIKHAFEALVKAYESFEELDAPAKVVEDDQNG